MPKVSAEHKERRREQILDGARRCFARHGYEGATVARLEQEIGLSRGAIFNYFPSKDALFIELAIEMSKRRDRRVAARRLPRRARCDRPRGSRLACGTARSDEEDPHRPGRSES